MEWWQQAASALIGVIVGVLLGAWLQRRTTREERTFRQKTELCNAMYGLLMEIEENLALAKKDPMAMLPIYPTDMWEVHKGKIASLPLTLQEGLQKAYLSIKGMNDITHTALAYASTKHLGSFNSLYYSKVREIDEPLRKAGEELAEWLVEEGCGKPRSG